MRAKTAALALAFTMVVVAATGACTAGDGGGSKAGGPAAPLTLTLGIDDIAGQTFAARQVAEFSRSVDTISGGHLRVTPVWRAAGADVHDWDQAVAGRVVDGKIDMGWIPTRAWDSLGVTTFRALNAPLLVTTQSLTNAITASQEADTMLAGLSSAGVVGIGLFPDGLRHPVSFGTPLRSAADYRGKNLRRPTSETADALFAALGADSDDYAGTFQSKLDTGEVTAAESSFEHAGTLPVAGTATGNVTFFPKVNSLVINADRHAGLSAAQREVLDRAAAATRTWVVTNQVPDAEAAAAYCRTGGTVVLASAADLASLRAATEPVYRQLEGDAVTKNLIAVFASMSAAKDPSAEVTRPCTPTSAPDTVGRPPGASSDEAADASVINGSYRFEVTDSDLAAHGVTDMGNVMENHGVYTWTLQDGAWRWEAKAPNVQHNPVGVGTYTISGDRITFSYPQYGETLTYGFALTDKGLRLTEVEPSPDAVQTVLMVAKVWQRVG
jgi:TRAP-type C4-dicarboxylate transport system substrate-binding protein